MKNKTKETAYFTICARNYMAYALTLAESIFLVKPDACFYIFLADEDINQEVPDGVTVLTAKDLMIPSFLEMAFRYSLMELSTAIKPSCFKYLLGHKDYSSAIYLDPDIQVFAPLTKVETTLKEGASAVLTPHLLQPLTDDEAPDELQILRSGTFNLGFAAFSDCEESRAFLDWWAEKLETNCLVDLAEGLFVDQKFVDFAPSFLPNAHILRHPGYNVAYWNLPNREIKFGDKHRLVNDLPLVFFHFSGIDPQNSRVFSKHQTRYSNENIGVVQELSQMYRLKLEKNNHQYWSKLPYAYGHFKDGGRILSVMRRNTNLKGDPSCWFQTADLAYWNAPSELVDQAPDWVMTRLMMEIYHSRSDLRAAYPAARMRNRVAYRDWFVSHGRNEYGFGDEFVIPIFRKRFKAIYHKVKQNVIRKAKRSIIN